MREGKWLAGFGAVAVLAGVSAARADLVISTGATQNVSCASGVCTATAQDAVLNVTDLKAMLTAGDATVKTGGGAVNIASEAVLSWTNASRLTLDAIQSIQIDKRMTVAGSGALTIVTNDGGTGGDLLFGNKGSTTFWDLSSSLVINGKSYTLVGDIATLAADIAANPSGFYALAKKIDARHLTFHPVPVPTEFQGTFEGLGQTISHLKIRHDKKNFEGFFAISDGSIRNVHLKQASVSSSSASNTVGALVGLNRGTIFNASAHGLVHGSAFDMGGLVGSNVGTVRNASAAVVIGGSASAGGGLIGETSGLVQDSNASGPVGLDSGSDAGGLVGAGNNISRCYATGAVTGGANMLVGGLGGALEHVDQSYASGPVAGSDNATWVGGFVGNGAFISNSYAIGSVQGGANSGVGGFAGEVGSTSVSYSLGAVSGGPDSKVGGFVGVSGDNHSKDDYWDIDTSGSFKACGHAQRCNGFTGLTTQQLQSGLPPGFDPKLWGEDQNINNGFPYLLALPPR